MGFASYDELKTAVLRTTRRTGDTTFEADFPRMVQFAEQRINYGGGAPMRSEPLRIRGTERTVRLNVVGGETDLPADYITAKRITWDSDIAFPLKPRTPDEFWQSYLRGTGLPMTYTVEGSKLYLAPPADGVVILTYNAKFAAVQTEDTITDRTGSAVLDRANASITQRTTAQSNWLMENAPAVVMSAVLIEAYKFLRNPAQMQEAYAEFVSAITGLNTTEVNARLMKSPAPRIKGATIR